MLFIIASKGKVNCSLTQFDQHREDDRTATSLASGIVYSLISTGKMIEWQLVLLLGLFTV